MGSGRNGWEHFDFLLSLADISASEETGSNPTTYDHDEKSDQHDDPFPMSLDPVKHSY